MALLAEGGAVPHNGTGRNGGGERTILDVATAVGFDSPSAFTRAFRRTTGESPSDYRARAHAGGSRG
jgi:AraC-like DNA-binding protein